MAITPLVFPATRPENYDFTSSVLMPASFRAVGHFLSFVALIVPARLLIRNRELGASIFTVNALLMNLHLFVQFLIWHTEDHEKWWVGEYYCDIMAYTWGGNFAECLNVASILVIMRHLAITVGDLRASPLTVKEKRWRNFTQLLLIVPWAVSTIPLHYITNRARYIIFATVGCTYVSDESWVSAAFMTILPLFFIVAGVYYAGKHPKTNSQEHEPGNFLTFIRFREVEMTAVVLRTRSTGNSVRAHRTRRRLYGMALTVAVPYFVLNLVGMSAYISGMKFGPFSFSKNHGPLYNTAVLMPVWGMTWYDHSWYWVWSIQTIPVFWFFGLTKDAVNMYRHGALIMGLGKLFPRLYEEYDPDRSRRLSGSQGSSSKRSWVAKFTAKLKNHLFDVSENDNELPQNWQLPPLPTLSTFNPFSTVDSSKDDDERDSITYSVDVDVERGLQLPPLHKSSTESDSESSTAVNHNHSHFSHPTLSGPLPSSSPQSPTTATAAPSHLVDPNDDSRPYGPYRSTHHSFPLMLFRNVKLPPFWRRRRDNGSGRSNSNPNARDNSEKDASSTVRTAHNRRGSGKTRKSWYDDLTIPESRGSGDEKEEDGIYADAPATSMTNPEKETETKPPRSPGGKQTSGLPSPPFSRPHPTRINARTRLDGARARAGMDSRRKQQRQKQKEKQSQKKKEKQKKKTGKRTS
ncbi:hypothetical protein MKZ38_003725 [Zalerion maritima]|uniref:Pheromone receptor n=1 Tax=Zalerion maritima TaxID=339359 RepID=A0AAD5RYB1_9PEZI|nr:hypothetical protein MKZ38_003725 [Zalerion maritima]